MKQAAPFAAASLVAMAACADTVTVLPSSADNELASGSAFELAGPAPQFGALVMQASAPPPISGGTLTIAPDGRTAVAADPDRDLVYVVDLAARALRHVVSLPAKAEPGRVAIDDESRAYVALRGSGGVAVIDLVFGTSTLRDACVAARGIAFDARARAVVVACAEGDVVTMDLGGGGVRSRIRLQPDLRDVLPPRENGDFVVSTFRSARLLSVTAGAMQETDRQSGVVAWRALATPPSGEPSVVSQDPSPAPIPPPVISKWVPVQAYYGGWIEKPGVDEDCRAASVIQTRLTTPLGSAVLPTAVLPVDLATNGREFVVVAAGNAFTPSLPQLYIVSDHAIKQRNGGCASAVHGNVPGQAIAAAFDGDNALVVQTREPAALHIMSPDRRRPYKTIRLSAESRFDSGHAIFHSSTGSFVACATCHAEGSDDGRAWEFSGVGLRRTPSLLGTVEGTAPYHWAGDMRDMKALFEKVFVERMRGPRLDEGQGGALERWLVALPAPKAMRMPTEETESGRVLFDRRCAHCHSGPRLTNNATFDVGTGGSFQVPSLVGVGWRAPFLHDGCAATLEDRFRCGKRSHGDEGLSDDEIRRLAAFLETL